VFTQSHTSFAKILAFAAIVLFVAAPAAVADSGTAAPNFPRAVPSQPGALTSPNRATAAARAQERYYTSYGVPTPVSHVSTPPDDGGTDWPAIAIAVGGTCLLGGALIAVLMRTRRRTARVRAVV
jgi:hypothetical protein